MSDPRADDPSLDFLPFAKMEPRAHEWLWQWHLEFGSLSVLDGDPGQGKSFLAADLCARLSAGRPWPDGTPGPGPAPCILLNAEDAPESTIRERLLAHGADLDRVIGLAGRSGFLRGPLRFPSGADVLDRVLARTGARLVVIDPIMSFLDPGVNTNSDVSVRRALGPLAALAAQYRCHVQMVRHPNKSGGFRSLYRGSGSIGIVGLCRAAWLAGPDPLHPGRGALAPVKVNHAPPQQSLMFTIEGPANGTAAVRWLGPCSWTGDQVMAAAGIPPPKPTARDRAREFLADVLAAGPRTSRDLWAKARERRLSPRTLDRARKELEIRFQRAWTDGKLLSYWLLPGQDLPAGATPQTKPYDLEPWLGPIREAFPPPNPLDRLEGEQS